MNEVEFIGNESYGMKQDQSVTFKDIIMTHLSKITKLASVEMRGGFYNHNMKGAKVYVPDSREMYVNAVEVLSDLLFAYFDKIMISADELYRDSKAQVKSTVTGKQHDVGSLTVHSYNKDEQELIRQLNLRLGQELFRELCAFLNRKRYLEAGVLED